MIEIGNGAPPIFPQYEAVISDKSSVLSFFNVKAYGAKGDGTTNDYAAVMAAINAADAAGGGTVFFPAGTYKINTTLKKITTNNISLVGVPNATVIDATSCVDSYFINIGGQDIGDGSNHPTVYKALGADVARGVVTITTTEELACAAGDVLLLTTYPNTGVAAALWSTTRDYYYKGEMVEVLSRTTTTITLKTPLYDNYAAAYTRVYINPSPKITVANLDIRRNTNVSGCVAIGSARDILIENVRVQGSRREGIIIEHVFGGTIRNCVAKDNWYSGTGSSYGFVISSCQNIFVEGNKTFSGRHGITNGGWEPNRNNVFVGNFVDNYHGSNACSFDFHENNEHCIVSNNVIMNSIIADCKSIKITDNIIYGNDYAGVYFTGSFTPVDYYIVQNNIIRNYNGSTGGVYMYFPVANVTVNYLDISHNHINTVVNGIQLGVKDATITGCVISKLTMNDNRVVVSGTMAIRCAYATSAQMSILELSMKGGYYEATVYQYGIYFDMTYAATPGNLHMTDVQSVAGGATANAIYAKNFVDAIVIGCSMKDINGAAGYGNQFSGSGKIILKNCYFENFTRSGIAITTFAECDLAANKFVNCTGGPTVAGMYRHNRGMAAAAPTTGTWAVGDYFENSIPAAGGYMGWMCTAAGTPGTWKGYGAIAS